MMFLLNYAIGRVESVLASIAELKGIEFPHKDSQDALSKLEGLFNRQLAELNSLDQHTAPEVIKQKCAFSLKDLFRCLPLLGFILRSTNVRNGFEIFGPLREVARIILEPGTNPENRTTKLLLSSEWEYSPVTYPEIPALPGFVLLGFPATESSNPLLVPLSGHELGHSVWKSRGLEQQFRPSIQSDILKYIRDHWLEYNALFPNVNSPTDLDTHLFARQTWLRALKWALRHAEESFCDFIGVRIFGASYLRAYAYLLSPNLSSPRSANYPDSMLRVGNLVKAAQSYNFNAPQDYEQMFRDRPLPSLIQSDKFQLNAADYAHVMTVDTLIEKANEIISSLDIAEPSIEEVARICARYKLMVPSEESNSLADILNAAWEAYEDDDLWDSASIAATDKDRILRDLVLKNVEIFNVDALLKGT